MTKRSANRILNARAELENHVKLCELKRMNAWEKTLSLHLKPKPKYMPVFIWKRILNSCLVQIVGEENGSKK